MEVLKEVKDITSRFGLGVEIQDGLNINSEELIREIEFAFNSQYLSGKFDDLGRYKPYYNITNFRLNVATRATDLDVKDVDLVADSPQNSDKTKVLRKEVYEWMKKAKFGQTLNDIGRTRAKYGGVLVKKVETKKDLKIEVCDWRNVIFDEVDINNGAIIEKHFMSPIDLNKKRGAWENIDEAIDLIDRKKERDERNEDKIEVLEIHGEFPISYFKQAQGEDWKDEDEYTYSEQKYFIASDDGEPKVLLFSEETKSPYKYLPYAKRDGASLGIGIIEEGLEAQRMVNNYIRSQYNAMELAGKTAIVTNSNTLGNNILTDFETGDVWKINENENVNSINLAPSAFTAFTGLIEQWDRQYERASSTFEAVTGETMPSGTPFRSVAIQNQEGTSLFVYRIKEFGLFVEEIVNEWILPHVIKKINKKHILNSNFSPEELQAIDTGFATRRANEEAIDLILSGKQISAEEYKTMIESYQANQAQFGDSRFLEVPDGFYDGWEGYATVMITNEKKNKAVMMESLANLLAQVAQAPQILQDPNLFKIFSKIVEMSGADISPTDFKPVQQQNPPGEALQAELVE